MEQDDRNGILSRGEEGCEMDIKLAELVVDGDFVVWEGVDVLLALSPGSGLEGARLYAWQAGLPVKLGLPNTLCFNEPVST